MSIYIQEFLYRGRPEGSAEPPAWHLVLASVADDGMGGTMRSEKILTMEQAAAAGWGLPAVVAAINAELMAELDGKRAQVAALQARLESPESKSQPEDAAQADAA